MFKVMKNYLRNCLKSFKSGYTLTEIVIVMLIIAVIVGVSLKITKAKFDSVIKYTYYSAYEILNSVAGEMIANSDLSEQYGNYRTHLPQGLNKYSNLIKEMFMQKTYAGDPCELAYPPNGGGKEACVNAGYSWCGVDTLEYIMVAGEDCYRCCHPIDEPTTGPDTGTDDTTTEVPTDPDESCSEGEIWDADLSSCRVPQTKEDCTLTQIYDADKQQCREKNISLPQNGNDFCEAFVDLTNTNSHNCSGNNSSSVKSAIDSGDFSELEADIILRNGMRLYNVKNPAVAIKKLEGNTTISMNSHSEPSLIEKIKIVFITIHEKVALFIHHMTELPVLATVCKDQTDLGSNTTINTCDFVCNTGSQKVCGFLPGGGTSCTCVSCGENQAYINGRCVDQITVGCDTQTLQDCTAKGGTIEDFSTCQCKLSTSVACSIVQMAECATKGKDIDLTTCDCIDKSCSPQICAEGYTLDETKGDCGECVQDDGAPSDSDDKDSPEISVPTLDGLNEKGYIVYVDIDGERGNSILYEDVYPFYITFSGLVIPAYEKGKEAGGNSKAHLQVSVKYDTYPSSRKVNWMTPKSTDFQHAACMSKYVTAEKYCEGVNDNNLGIKQVICEEKESDCRIVPNKPLKF